MRLKPKFCPTVSGGGNPGGHKRKFLADESMSLSHDPFDYFYFSLFLQHFAFKVPFKGS